MTMSMRTLQQGLERLPFHTKNTGHWKSKDWEEDLLQHKMHQPNHSVVVHHEDQEGLSSSCLSSYYCCCCCCSGEMQIQRKQEDKRTHFHFPVSDDGMSCEDWMMMSVVGFGQSRMLFQVLDWT